MDGILPLLVATSNDCLDHVYNDGLNANIIIPARASTIDVEHECKTSGVFFLTAKSRSGNDFACNTRFWFYICISTALHCFCAFIYIVNIYLQLDLFNDDTRPPEHISRPTQVNVSQSCFHFLNKLLTSDHIVQVSRLVLINKLHHIR